jgi:hypothetical protein
MPPQERDQTVMNFPKPCHCIHQVESVCPQYKSDLRGSHVAKVMKQSGRPNTQSAPDVGLPFFSKLWDGATGCEAWSQSNGIPFITKSGE